MKHLCNLQRKLCGIGTSMNFVGFVALKGGIFFLLGLV